MKKGQVIKLEDGKIFAIVELIELHSDRYIYIVNLEDNKDIRFALLNDDRLYFVNDANLYASLMVEVAKKQMNNQ